MWIPCPLRAVPRRLSRSATLGRNDKALLALSAEVRAGSSNTTIKLRHHAQRRNYRLLASADRGRTSNRRRNRRANAAGAAAYLVLMGRNSAQYAAINGSASAPRRQ